MRSKAANALLLIASCGVSLGIAEAVARSLYEPPLAIVEENFVPFAETGLYTPPRNALGFREEPPGKAARDPDVTRILVLGDSFTFGDGVRRGEDRFTDRVEASLNREALDAGRAAPYHVYNAGVSGSRPVAWLHHFRRLRGRYMPDLVLAVFFLRDGTDLCTSLRCHEDTIRRIKARYASRFGHDWSYLAKLFYARAIERDFYANLREQIVRSYLGSEGERKTWRVQRAALRQLDKLCRRSGARLHLIVFPMLLELDHYPFEDVEREILRAAAEVGIPAFSLLEGFRGRDARRLWVAPNDQHPNERAHAIAAETLLPYLRTALTMPR